MTRPWTWALADDGEVHATAVSGFAPGTELSAVCGRMVVTRSGLSAVSRVNPCLSCLQLVGVIDWHAVRAGAR
jgi:hypothetical protein